MTKRLALVDRPEPRSLDTARATLAACEWDLDREEERMRGLDTKLTQLATFSGVAISISGGLGGSVLAAGRLTSGFRLALGGCLGIAGVLFLLAVILAFRTLSPKAYQGIDEAAVVERTRPSALRRRPEEALAAFVGTRRDVLIAARSINDAKAQSTVKVFAFVSGAFAALVSALLVTAVASVV